MTSVRRRLPALVLALLASTATGAAAQTRPRSLGEIDVALYGLAAGVEPLEPIVPKETASGLRIVVRAGGRTLSGSEVARLLGGPFQVQAELSGPGLAGTLSLPLSGPEAIPSPDPLILTFPGLTRAGEYQISNIRLVRNGRPVLDVVPRQVTLRVIEQILVSAVSTRSLTLDEIRERGILLDPRAYLGFEFTVTLKLESTPVRFSFPAVFDRQGVPIPMPLQPPPEPLRSVISPPQLVPVLMRPAAFPGDPDGAPPAMEDLADLGAAGVRIPSLIVFPGSAHYLKQFFSVQLMVGNGAPEGAPLVVRDVQGTLRLPPGADGVVGTADDPLALPETEQGPQSPTVDVRAEDGSAELRPGEFGRAELTVRGEQEGTHRLEFDLRAMLDGLPVGPVAIEGHAHGAVLVRNAYFNMTFTVPTVVRADEDFSLFATVTNVGQGAGQDVKVTIDGSRLSGATLLSPATQTVDRIPPGDSRTVEYRFKSQVTGEVVASYLRFDTNGGVDVTGRLNFAVAVGEQRVALSPDTLVLPSSVKALPPDVVRGAMRLLGQAWSAATAATLPTGVERPAQTAVFQKGLAVAEAGLRVQLGQPLADALRDLLLDLHGRPVDLGFDQTLRETSAGRDLDRVLGASLQAAVSDAGGVLAYEERAAQVAASGPPFLSFAAHNAGGGAWPAEVTLLDGSDRRTELDGTRGVPLAGLVRTGSAEEAPRLGWVSGLEGGPYTIQIDGRSAGAIDLSLSVPTADGGVRHARLTGLTVGAGSHARLIVDPARGGEVLLERDPDGDGIYLPPEAVATTPLLSTGPRLIAATTLGPETLDGTSPFGVHAALLFDRVVSAADAARTESYQIADNTVLAAQRQLSGRLVFVALEQPEGPLVPTRLAVQGIADERGEGGERQEVPLLSRLVLPGAVVTGRVLQADGTPVAGALVTYFNSAAVYAEGRWDCSVGYENALTAQRTDGAGRFTLRYVSQSPCGAPFRVETQDPQTGAVRGAKTYVRTDGQHIVLDLVLIGNGAVTGTVRQATGQPAAGARVRVVSVTDSQIGGVTTTDEQGVYRVPGITVGAVTVTAVLGANLGRGAGRLDNAGGTTTVDVTLDGNVTLTGVVKKLENGLLSPVPGVDVVYYRNNVPLGVSVTDSQGRYRLAGVPAGPYRLEAGLNQRDKTSVGGNNVAGQSLVQDLVIEIRDAVNYGTVRGTVRRRDGQVVAGAWVSDGIVAARADDLGRYELVGVALGPTARPIQAVSPDGRRTGSTSVVVSVAGQVVTGADIQVSGLGTAAFQVVDPAGQPVAGATVGLQGNCFSPCGCRFTTTNAQGVATFRDLPFGGVTAMAVTQAVPGRSDAASGTASISSEDIEGGGIIRFSGFGTVSGIVRNPDGTPAHGASVVMTAPRFINGGGQCGLIHVELPTSTDENGRFRFENVHVGWVQVRAWSDVFPSVVASSQTLAADGNSLEFDLRLINTMAGVLSGTVFLPGGAGPVGAGVEVSASGPIPEITVRTLEDGTYSFAPILPAGYYSLVARDTRPDGTGSLVRTYVYLQPGQPARHDLTLKARGTVRVRVVDGNDVPPPNATVHVRIRENDFPYRSYEGTISSPAQQPLLFPSIFEGDVSVEASDNFARGGRASATVPPSGQAVDVKVRLTTTGTVKGRFLWADGTTPIPFGTVRLIAGGWVIGQQTTASEGEVGSFSFDYVPAGQLQLQAQDPRSGRTGVAWGTLSTEGQVLTVDVTAYAVGRVEGDVTLNNAPAPTADVSIRSGGYSVRVTADGAGHYAVDGVPAGQVYASADLGNGFLAGSAQGTLRSEGETLGLPIPLRGAATLEGRLLAPDGVSPGAVSLITLTAYGSTQTTTTDAQGHFRFDLVPEGSVELLADVLSSVDCARRTLVVQGGQTVPVDLTLIGVGAVEGTADSASGPVGGTLTVYGMGPGCYGTSWNLTVGPGGTFRIPEVLSGPVSASFYTAAPNGPWLYASASAVVTPASTAQLHLHVEPSGSVRGRVLHENGQPALGALVRIESSGWRASAVQTAGDGSFLAEGIPAGPITVRVSHGALGGVALVTGLVVFDNTVIDTGTVSLIETPLAVTAASPAEGAADLPINTAVQLTFNAPLAHAGGLSVRAGSDYLGFAVAFGADQRSVTLTPYGAGWPDSREITVDASIWVTDIYGRHLPQAFARRFRTVDLSPPRVVGVVPAAGAIQVNGSTVVNVTFDEPIVTSGDLQPLLRLSLGGTPVAGTVTTTGPGTLLFTPASAWASNSTYTVTVNGASDLLGHVQTVPFASVFMTTDTTPPVLHLQSPPDGGWTKDRRPTISVLVTDSLSGSDTTRATLSLDGQPVPVGRGSGFFNHTPQTDLADGLHTVLASAEDRGGNRAEVSGSFRVDSVLPSVAQLTAPAANAVLAGTATLAATATDDASGVASVVFLRDGFTVAGATAAQGLSGGWNTSGTVEGEHFLTARALDVAGNMGPAGSPVRVIVNNLAVGVSITAPAAGRHFATQVRVTAQPTEPVARLEFQAGNAAPVVDDTAPYEATLDLTSQPEGELTLTVRAVGLAPEEATATRTIVVDRTPPPPPDLARIHAETNSGAALVLGVPGAVEASSLVEVRNATSGATNQRPADGAGSFVLKVAGAVGQALAITATDEAGNRSDPAVLTVAEGPSDDPTVPRTGLRIWARSGEGIASDAAGRVSRWSDQSGQGNDLTQSTAAQQPVLASDPASGMPVLRFDGSDDWLRFTTRMDGTIRAVFAVWKENDNGGTWRAFLSDASVGDFFPGWQTLWYGAGSTSASILQGQTWLNGAPVDGTATRRPLTLSVLSLLTTGGVTADRLFGAMSGTGYGRADIAELLVYDQPLADAQRKSVEDYLVRKYALYVPRLDAPTIAPDGALFTPPLSVTLQSPTPAASLRYTLDGTEPTESSTLYAAPLTLTQSATVKARAFRPGHLTSETATAGFVSTSAFSPASVSGLALWARADAGVSADAVGRVSAWRDQSGRSNDLSQGSLASRPVRVPGSVNGLPVLRFDGANDWLRFTTGFDHSIRAVFAVWKENDDGGTWRAFLGDGSSNDFFPGWQTLWYGAGSTSASILQGQTWLNGVAVDGTVTRRPLAMSVLSVTTTAGVTADRLFAAMPGTGWGRGDIAELIVYDQPLTDSQRKSVEDYLAVKYGVYTGTAGTPEFTPNGGTFTGTVTVSLGTPTPGAEIRYTTDGTDPTTASTLYTAAFALSATTTVKARAFLAGMSPSAVSTVMFVRAGDFSPASVGGLALWTRTDAGVGADAMGRVSVWRDQSGRGNDLGQDTLVWRPVLVPDSVNGRPVIRFDGSNDWLKFTTRLSGTIRAVFAVWKENDDGATWRTFLADAGSADFTPGWQNLWYGPGSTSASILQGQTWLNGVSVDGTVTRRPQTLSVMSVTTTAGVTADRLFAALPGYNYGRADIAELIVYDQPLTGSQGKSVEDYLALKYAAYVGTAGAPEFAPSGGTFTDSVTVSLSTPTPGATLRYTTDGSDPLPTSTLYEAPFALTTTATVKARAFHPAMTASPVSVASFLKQSAFSPAAVPGLALWTRADADVLADAAARVSLWRDQSGAHNDLGQDVVVSQPLLIPAAVNGLPVIRFDGSNDWLKFATRLSGTIRAVFAVWKENDDGTTWRTFLGDVGGADFTPGWQTLWYGAGSTSASILQGQTWLNGVPVDGTVTRRPLTLSVMSVVTTAGVSADRLFAALPGYNYGRGDIAELIVYDQPISDSQRKAVEDYLALKYAAYTGTAGAPEFTPNGGAFTDTVTVTLTTPTPDAEIRYTVDGSDPVETSASYLGAFEVTTTTTVKARTFRTGMNPSPVAVARFIKAGDFSPATVGGLALWARTDAGVDADAAGRVSLWRDQSGRANDLSQTTVVSRPLLVPAAVNGLPVIRFDGANDWLKFATRLNGTIRAVFAVWKENDDGATWRTFLGDVGAADFTPGWQTLWYGAGSTSASILQGQTWLNGVPVDGTGTRRPLTLSVMSVVTTAGVSADRLFAALPGYNYGRGDIAELIVYDQPISDSQRKAVEDYLALKYAAYTGTAGAPEFTPNGGTFADTVTVTLTTPTPGGQIRYTVDGSTPDETSSLYSGPLELSATTTVKARAFQAGMNASPVTTAAFTRSTDFSPASVAGLALWARADAGVNADAAGRVSLWRDQSGRANDLAQSAVASRPVLVPGGMNGLPVIRFDGANDWLSFATRLNQSIRAVFAVWKENDDGGTWRTFLGDGSSPDFSPGWQTLWYGSTSASIRQGQTWLNGVLVDGQNTRRPLTMSVLSLTTLGGVTADRLFGAIPGNNYGRADIAELILFTEPLTDAQRKSVEDYLALKYAAYVGTAGAPSFSPAPGVFQDTVTVGLSAPTPGAQIRYTTDGTVPTSESALLSAPLELTATTTVKARAFHSVFAPSPVTIGHFVRSDDVSPARLSGMALWVRSDTEVVTDASGHVTSWRDQSGQSNHLVQATATSQPTLVPGALNGLPVLHFDGTDDWLQLTSRLYQTVRAAFVVLKEDPEPLSWRNILGDGQNWDFHQGETTFWNGTYANVSVRSGQTRLNSVLVDGTVTNRPKVMSVLSVVTTGGVTVDRLFIDRNYMYSCWKGDIAELILYTQAPTDAERKWVEDYLALKYGLYVPAASVPVFDPAGSIVAAPLPVRLTTTTPGAQVYYTTDGSTPSPSSTPYTGPFVVGTRTTVKARAFRAAFAPSPTAAATFLDAGQSPVPPRFAGLKLWVKADAGLTLSGTAVTDWADQSGNGNHLTQATAGARPQVVSGAANGLPVVRLDGVDDVLMFTNRLVGIRTLFWVVRQDASATGCRFLLGDSTNWDFHSECTTKLWHPSYTHAAIRSGQTRINGTLVDGTTTNVPTTLSLISVVTADPATPIAADAFSRDRSYGRSWFGDLAELVIYDRALSDSERDAVEGYLAAKYALYTPAVTAPSISPAGGRLSGSPSVTMDCATGGATIHYTTDDTDPTETSATYTEPLVLTGTTRIRARAFLSGWNPSPTTVVTFFGEDAFTPASVPNLALWVRGDAGLGPDRLVSGWMDQSARANALVQPSLPGQPLVTLDPTTRLPVLHFDGIDDVLLFTARLTGIRTVFWVVRRDPSATGYRFLLGDVNNYDFCSGSAPQVWDATYANPAIRAGETRLNGEVINGTSTTLPTALSLISVVTTEPPAPIAADAFSRDRTYGRSWFGDLGELVVYDRALSAAEVRSVAEYLAARWGLSLAP